ncbi:unnamed protein product, partial [Mesorhabditis belari]|uniref:N-acetyltransferase domain-containing protein n=1 Tax=Mesorhabditis belari TaxID=2138241 RepID=A0AAF3J631_9BILA
MLRSFRTGVHQIGRGLASKTPEHIPSTLSLEKATISDLPALSRLFLSNFVHDEPHARALRMGNEAAPLFEAIAGSCLKQPYSLKLTDNAQSHKLIGFRLLGIGHRDSSKDPYPVEVDIRAPNVLTFAKLMSESKKLWLDALPHVNKVLRREISYVMPAYQRKGIGAYMLHYGLNFEKLKSDGVQGIVSEATSLANQRLLSLNGYKEVAVLPDSAYENLNLQFENGTRNIKAYYLELK